MNNLDRGHELCRISKLSRNYDNSNETRTWLTVCTEKLFLGHFTSFLGLAGFLEFAYQQLPHKTVYLFVILQYHLPLCFVIKQYRGLYQSIVLKEANMLIIINMLMYSDLVQLKKLFSTTLYMKIPLQNCNRIQKSQKERIFYFRNQLANTVNRIILCLFSDFLIWC